MDMDRSLGAQTQTEKKHRVFTLVFPERVPSQLQSELAKRVTRTIKFNPPATADKLVSGVLQEKNALGANPLPPDS